MYGNPFEFGSVLEKLIIVEPGVMAIVVIFKYGKFFNLFVRCIVRSWFQEGDGMFGAPPGFGGGTTRMTMFAFEKICISFHKRPFFCSALTVFTAFTALTALTAFTFRTSLKFLPDIRPESGHSAAIKPFVFPFSHEGYSAKNESRDAGRMSFGVGESECCAPRAAKDDPCINIEMLS